MNIIEKLGLMPIKELKRSPENGFLIEEQETYNLNLVKAAPEMLEALIELVKESINDKMAFYGSTKTTKEITNYYYDEINIIEKVTGKTWKEIEDLSYETR